MSGQGHPEAADIAGMPAAYLIRQMTYYKTGTRQDDARMGPIAKVTSDEDARQAAEASGSRANQSRPMAINSGPATRNRRDPKRPASVPTRVDSTASMMPVGNPTTPAPRAV